MLLGSQNCIKTSDVALETIKVPVQVGNTVQQHAEQGPYDTPQPRHKNCQSSILLDPLVDRSPS